MIYRDRKDGNIYCLIVLNLDEKRIYFLVTEAISKLMLSIFKNQNLVGTMMPKNYPITPKILQHINILVKKKQPSSSVIIKI